METQTNDETGPSGRTVFLWALALLLLIGGGIVTAVAANTDITIPSSPYLAQAEATGVHFDTTDRIVNLSLVTHMLQLLVVGLAMLVAGVAALASTLLSSGLDKLAVRPAGTSADSSPE